MIREATEDDIARIVEMGRSFFDASGYAEVMEFDPASAETTARKIMADPSGVVLVAENNGRIIGMVAGLLYPFFFDNSHLTGQELVWWIDSDHRTGTAGIRLIRAFEKWAEDRGAKTLTMFSIQSYRRVARLYEKRGYIPSEHSFIKRF